MIAMKWDGKESCSLQASGHWVPYLCPNIAEATCFLLLLLLLEQNLIEALMSEEQIYCLTSCAAP